jgi:hypothetical protein
VRVPTIRNHYYGLTYFSIVFIHGFTGHPERTWTSKEGPLIDRGSLEDPETPVTKFRKFHSSSGSRSAVGKTSAVYWPRDLLPKAIPDARILTYGYDTNIKPRLGSPQSQTTVYDIAWNFLIALEASRRDDPLRHMLFVAHSLGGIVVKEALRRSNNCQFGVEHLASISKATKGIMFFGTPHRGADTRGTLQHVAESIIRSMVTVNEQVVQSLLPNSERLKELRSEFIGIAHKYQWRVHSFQEDLGVKAINGRKVITVTS